MGELLGDPDPARAQRALQAMLQMSKIDIQTLEDAADEVDRWKNPISSMTP